MRKLYTFLGAALMTSIGFAQVDIHLDNDPGVNYNGQTVDIVVNNSNTYTVYMHAVNTSGTDQNYNFRRLIVSSNTSFSDQFCDNNLCYPTSGNDWTTPSSNPITVGDSSVMKPLYTVNDGGSALIRYYVLDANNNNQKIDSVDVRITSGIGYEELKNVKFTAYPNPANAEFNIDFNGVTGGNYNVALYNLLGEEVGRRSLTNGLNTIDVSHLNNGVYFYSILLNNEVIETKKLVVRH